MVRYIISLGNIDRNIIFILLGGLGNFFAGLITKKYGDNLDDHPLILGINAALGMSLSIIPFIFLKIISRKKHTESGSSEEKLIYTNIYEEHYNNMRLQKYGLILLSCILDYGQKILTFVYIETIENNFWIFDISFVTLFSFFILKTKLYRFQYLCLLIIIIRGIILNVINLYNLKENWLYLLLVQKNPHRNLFHMVNNNYNPLNIYLLHFLNYT